MRKVTCAFNMSLDGCYDHTMIDGDAELHEYFAELGKDTDLVIYGRKMYELIVPYWKEMAKKQSGEKGTDDFAKTVEKVQKIVVSTTMQTAEEDTTILRGNVEEELRRLKALPGGNISIAGMTLRAQLAAADLIDEYTFVVHPVMIGGDGPRWLAGYELKKKMGLKLVESKILSSGAVGLRYVRDRK